MLRTSMMESVSAVSPGINAVLDSLAQHVAVLDAHGTIVTVNRAWDQFASSNGAAPGQAAGAFVGSNYLDACGTEGREVAEGIRAVLAGNQRAYSCEYPCHSPTEHRWFRLSVTPLHGAEGAVCVHDNITEHVRDEGARRLFGTIMENMGDGVQMTRTADHRIIYANPAFERMFGYESGGLTGHDVSELNAAGPEDPKKVVAEILSALHEKGLWQSEIRNRRRDGTSFWTSATVSRFQHAEYGDVCITVQSDITERRRIQEALRTSLTEKETLLREVHHRVKNNLQVISSLLRLEGRRTESPEDRRGLTEMEGRVRSMALLHETLYRRGSFNLVQLADYVKDVAVQLVRAQRGAGGIELDLDLSPCAVIVDQAIPCGLLVNELVSNSLKHGFPPGASGRIRIRLGPLDDGRYRLTVQDSGRGLPDDYEARAESSLGLQLVHDLARQIGGALEAGPAPAPVFSVAFRPVSVDPRGPVS